MAARFECDVIVVGLGPSGMMAAAFMLQRGWRVAVIERHAALYGLPRAGHVDHEIVRFMQELGVSQPFLDDAYPIGSYRWFNGQGDILLEMNWGGQSVSGFNSDYMMYQPVLEDCIQSVLDRHADRLTLLRSRDVTQFSQDAQGVTCKAVDWRLVDGVPVTNANDEVIVSGKYLLAADGARSGTREKLGIAREDLGFNEVWLDVDVRVLRPLPAMDPHQICDPKRPAFISPLGKRHHRFEWAILPGENPADFAQPDMAWKLLAGEKVGPEDVEIVRQQVYVFEARIAEQWQDDRIFLLGDAAHTMPPFMGQGACAGMRDAVNLSWKLDLVLAGRAPEAILASYQTEREPHARTWVELSMRTGEVSCTLDVEAAAQRDAMLLAGEAPPMPDFPDLTAGILDSRPEGDGHRLAGTLFPQREVSAGGRSGWIDDVIGTGFRLVTWDLDHDHLFSSEQQAFLASINTRHIALGQTGIGGQRVIDDSGFYRAWMAESGLVGLIVRPDHYIFGVAADAADLPWLVDSLRARIGNPAMANKLVSERA